MSTASAPLPPRLVPVIAEHIEITPGVCGGKPRIVGHRITVQNIVLWHERGGMPPEQIVSTYPGLTLGDVYAALAYYHDHREEIRAQIDADERFVSGLQAQASSLVQEKLAARIRNTNSGAEWSELR